MQSVLLLRSLPICCIRATDERGQQRILLACLHQGNSIFPRALNSAGRRLS